MDPSTYTIPIAYTPVIKHFFKSGEFAYLKFDGKNFHLPYTRMQVFLEDLQAILPKGERALDMIDRSFDLWEKAMPSILGGSNDPDIDLSKAQKAIPMERIKRIVLGEESIPDFGIPQKGREIGEGVAESMKNVDWLKVAKVILVILVLLFIIGIVVIIACAGADGVDLRGHLQNIRRGQLQFFWRW
ncbi:MAG: hypothetical protein QCI82_08635 [Candidatus Thermoplasmatota archaeon]|nr:hypothetical protein [Candidatus Thermoplasmatota archaeon]